MSISQITVQSVWAVVTTLLTWEVTRIVVGVGVALWAIGQIFDFLQDHGITGELHRAGERGRATRSEIESTLHDLEDAEFEEMYGGRR